MHNILIIAKREYLERVRTRSFVIMTFFIPLLMFGAILMPTLLMNRASNETKHMVVVAADRDTAEMIRSRIEQKQDEEKSGSKADSKLQKRGLPPSHFTVEVSTNTADSERAALTAKVNSKQLDGFLWATPDAIKAHKLDFVTRDVSSFIENGVLGQAVSDALRRNALKNKGLKDDEIECRPEAGRSGSGEPAWAKMRPTRQAMFFTTFGMVMVMYMTVLLYGINVMRAILEEKTSRIMEVMLSTASAKEMMAGKILGVGAVGLTQVGIWAVTAGVVSGGALVASAGMIKGVLSVKLLIFFGVYFLLGYVLYSTLCAAVGSMVNSEQEAQQLQFLVMMPMILSVFVIVNIFQHPNSQSGLLGIHFSIHRAAGHVYAGSPCSNAAGLLADCALHWPDAGDYLRHGAALRSHLPRWNPDVR